MVYGLNHYNDEQADAVNKRKGNFLFVAQATRKHLEGLLKKITMVILPFVVIFTYLSGLKMFLLLVFMVGVNILYNFKPFRIKERPPFEIHIQVGYVTTVLIATELNNLDLLPWQTLTYLSLFAFQAHIAREIIDIEPDLEAKKRTTATLLKRKKLILLMLVILLLELFLVWYWFQGVVLAWFLGVFALWLIFDIIVFFKDRP